MYIHNNQAGFGSVAIVGLIGMVLLAGGAIFLSKDEKKPEDMTKSNVSQETSKEMTDSDTEGVSHETDDVSDGMETMMKDDSKMDKTTDEELASDGAEMSENGLIIDSTEEIDTTFLPESQPGEFIKYAEGTLAYAETGDVILFFHADWCSSCRGLESDINANLSAIPDGLSIQKIDYDTATDLKKKYGVVRQHTLVQVDESGNAIKTLTGLTNTLDQVASQL